MLPFVVVALVAFFAVFPSLQGGHSPSGVQIAMMVGGGFVVLIGICLAVYCQYCWLFTLWLVIDKHMGFWQAMNLSRAVVNKHWWWTFCLGLIAGLLVLAGLFLCGVGVLVTGPLAVGMFAAAYERLFGDMQPA